MVAIGLLIAWLVVVPSLIVLGVRQVVGQSGASSDEQADARKAGVIDLAFAAAIGVAPLIAWRLAVSSTGWVDSDGDGMLDGFVAGQYDLFDFLVPSAVMWGLGLIVVLVAVRELLRRRVVVGSGTPVD